jgi:hypothetical protein
MVYAILLRKDGLCCLSPLYTLLSLNSFSKNDSISLSKNSDRGITHTTPPSTIEEFGFVLEICQTPPFCKKRLRTLSFQLGQTPGCSTLSLVASEALDTSIHSTPFT